MPAVSLSGIRARTGGLGGIEDFLHAYSLSTKEGLALMVLAEALLRVPDAATADRLIEDKLADRRLVRRTTSNRARLLVSASAWTLGITARIIHPGETPDTILQVFSNGLGMPAVRAATRQAMRLLGSHFVLGQTIEEALERARNARASCAIPSTCWERARARQPTRSAISPPIAHAIDAIAASAGKVALSIGPGISVKLSALHPRFEAMSRERGLTELGAPGARACPHGARARPQFHRRCRGGRPARTHARRGRSACSPTRSLRGWDGFGLAVQAYQKRAPAVIDWLDGDRGRAAAAA